MTVGLGVTVGVSDEVGVNDGVCDAVAVGVSVGDPATTVRVAVAVTDGGAQLMAARDSDDPGQCSPSLA